MSRTRLRRTLGASRLARRLTDSPPIGRVIAATTHSRLVRPSLTYVARELSAAERTGRYRVRYGDLTVYLRHNTSDSSILDEVFLKRIYEPPAALDAQLNLLKHPLRIADLGANIGLFGAFALARWLGARVLAFEPHPRNAALLRRTVAANDLGEHWKVIEACAHTADGQLPFVMDHFSDSHVLEPIAEGRERELAPELVAAVDVFPLLRGVDLIKIDIEGGEWALLADPRFAELTAVAIAIEYHPRLAPGPEPRVQACGALHNAGYAIQEVFHDPRGHGMLWAWREAGPARAENHVRRSRSAQR
jgi:FkbM family methyltransferase